MNSFLDSDFVSTWTRAIDDSLQGYMHNMPGECPDVLRESMSYSLLLPGKRIRPLLVLLAADACGADPQKALPAACAVEMVHAFSLIHDDLPAMDDDDVRRGQPANHKKYGEAQAILAGDALLAYAFSILAEELDSSIAAGCCSVLARATGPEGMIGGQCLDMDTQQQNTIDNLESMHQKKTGALLVASLHMGALIADASEEQLQSLLEYGKRIGLVFQIIDDVLDEGEDERSYTNLLGVEESKAKAEKLTQEACSYLEVFQDRSAPLCSLAELVLTRDH